jgi:hydroxymethylglutaryl-CoA reductase (NADPH)
MRGSSLLPKRFRTLGQSDGWLNRQLTSNLLSISYLACQHPIHTIVVIALLASTSYVGLLQQSLFDASSQFKQGTGYVDVDSLLVGSRTLELSKNTAWKWQVEDSKIVPQIPQVGVT